MTDSSQSEADIPAAPLVPAPVLTAPEYRSVPVTDTRAGFLAAVEALAAGSGPIAVDAERASGFKYSQRAYLIQFYRRGSGTFLFDPPAIADFTALQHAVGGDEWVLHAASQDLPCLREVGLDPERIFDTELAARLLGMPRVGLGTVVAELLGIGLEKAHSAADWSTRPLPESWLKYAALDVALLIDVRDRLAAQLDAAGKSGIAAEEFDAVLLRQPKPPPADPWRKLSGIHALRSPRQLAVARELWLARDAYAQQIDVAPGRLVPDRALLAAAAALPKTHGELVRLKEFTGRASRSESARWWAAVQRGLGTESLPPLRVASDALPPTRVWADRLPEAHARYQAAKEYFDALHEQTKIPLENLLTPETMRRLAWQPPEPLTLESLQEAMRRLGARRWQIEMESAGLLSAFVGARQEASDAVAETSAQAPKS